MSTTNHYQILTDLISNVDKSVNIESYLTDSIKYLNNSFKPTSIAAYISIETEEKIVLIAEFGENFDKQIELFYNFTSMVRNAITNREVVIFPTKEDKNTTNNICLILMPLIGNNENIGMIGLIYPISQLPEHENLKSFYTLMSHTIGTVAQLKRLTSNSNKLSNIDPDEDYSDKILSLEVLSSGVAHEFNNIFAVIKGYAELMLLQDIDEESIKTAVDTIDKQTERGAELIERLNIFVKGKVDKLEYHSLNDIIEEICDMQSTSLKNENIEVKSEFNKIPKILVNKNQIKEVLLNIFLNARHAMRPKGSGILSYKTEFIGDSVVLIINDNGIGMTKDHVDHALNPFFTTKGSLGGDLVDGKKSGTGLGLAISYGIIESHGGNITITSEPDVGTEVRIVFKRIEPGVKEAKYKDKEIVYFGDIRILIVDDEDAFRDFLSSVFDKMGYQVISVSNGEDAVEICSVENIDIVLLDYLMPGLRGDKTFHSIKKVSPESDIVFITGAAEIPDIQLHLKDGLAYILKKPFKIEEIIKVTNDLIYQKFSESGGE